MKAGRELDERLCRLLEPKPTAQSQFWQQQVFDWKPIPVSTDGTAMIKASGAVIDQLDCDIEFTLYAPYRKASCAAACWVYKEKPRGAGMLEWGYMGEGANLPEAFALAACEALERSDGYEKLSAFWATRAENYNKLDWVHREGYLQSVIAASDPQPQDRVLDLGTGTGIVAHAISPLVADVVGIDISLDMLAKATHANFIHMDASDLRFPNNSFDKVIARMVFHHLIDNGCDVMLECYRVLKPGGLMVLSEGVPPHESLRDWYTEMFALKEERKTFFTHDLLALMSDFRIEQVITHVSRQVSIDNWLRNSGLPQGPRDKIMQMHLELDKASKQHYNMTITANDVLCDFKLVTVTGRKEK